MPRAPRRRPHAPRIGLAYFCSWAMTASANCDVPTAVGSSGLRLQVVGDVLALGDDRGDGAFHAVGRVALAEVAQHQHAGEHHRGRVGLVLAGVLGRRAVRRLEQRGLAAVVGAGRDAEAADEAGAEVGDDVAVEVRQHHHVVQLGLLHELHAHVVDDAILELDVAVALGDLARDAQPEAVGVLHDVGLVDDRDLAASLAAGVVERELDDAARALDRDRLDRDARVLADLRARELLDRVAQHRAARRCPPRTRCRRRDPRCSRARSRGRRRS